MLSDKPLSDKLQRRIGFWAVLLVIAGVLAFSALNLRAARRAPEQAAVMAQEALRSPENIKAIAKAANPAQVAEPSYAFSSVEGEDAELWDQICEIKGAMGMRLPPQCVPRAPLDAE